jgi:hypothetical protein
MLIGIIMKNWIMSLNWARGSSKNLLTFSFQKTNKQEIMFNHFQEADYPPKYTLIYNTIDLLKNRKVNRKQKA